MTRRIELQLLHRARALIELPDHWAKGAFALSAKGINCEPESTAAKCFCTIGAIRRARSDMNREGVDLSGVAAGRHLSRWAKKTTYGRVAGSVEFNDHPDTRHADVLRMFDETIAELSRTTGEAYD